MLDLTGYQSGIERTKIYDVSFNFMHSYRALLRLLAEEFGLVGTASHVYRSVGQRHVVFSVHGHLASVGRCDHHAVSTTVCTTVDQSGIQYARRFDKIMS